MKLGLLQWVLYWLKQTLIDLKHEIMKRGQVNAKIV